MTTRAPRPDGLDIAPTRVLRSNSLSSSDVMSASTKSAATIQVPAANPPPAYIAQAEASELISAELDRRVTLTPSALTLVNEFLDHVLYSLIATSSSVSLAALKNAVPNVLKPRLGKAALRVAEEELKEYLEDEDEEELRSKSLPNQHVPDLDLDLVWKLARLRCMVYARMGDLEEEDEEEWLEKEHLLEQTAATATSATRQSMEIGPAAAILLTSVIEYLGEQALYYAAQHAQKRHNAAKIRDHAAPTTAAGLLSADADEIVLDGKDMNHVGRDSPLSRLWRSWRRNTRTAGGSLSRSMSPEAGLDSPYSPIATGSTGYPINSIVEERHVNPSEVPLPASPFEIPLPITDNDIDEIEGRGYWTRNYPLEVRNRRALSLQYMPGQFPDLDYADAYYDDDDVPPPIQERSPLRPSYHRLRSNSVPHAIGSISNYFSVETPGEPEDAMDEEPLKEAEQLGSAEDLEDDILPIQRPEEAELTPEAASVDGKQYMQQTPGAVAPVRELTPDSRQSGLVNNTIAALAGTFGAVGVYQVRNRSPHGAANLDARPSNSRGSTSTTQSAGGVRQRIEAANKINSAPTATSAPRYSAVRRTESPNQPQMSAAITSPKDFDDMHVPDWRATPENGDGVIRDPDTARDLTPSPALLDRSKTKPAETTGTAGASSKTAEQVDSSRWVPSPEPVTSVHDAVTQPLVPTGTNVAHSSATVLGSPVSPSSMRSRQADDVHVPSSDGAPAAVSSASNVQPYAERAGQKTSPSHSKSSSSSSRLLGFTRDATGKPQIIHQQWAAGDMAESARAARSATPTSTNQAGRPETSTSFESRKQAHLRIRGDSENSVPRFSPVDQTAQRNLEVLINSDETLHYTLTPATATFRQDDINPSPKRTQTQDLADFFRNTAPPGQESQRPKSSSRSKQNSIDATRTVAAEAPPVPVTNVQQGRKVIPSSKSVNQGATPVAARTRNPLGEPRDAKVERSNVRDLADYARSTGPTNEGQLPQALSSPASAASPRTYAAATAAGTPPTKASAKPANRLKFQARDARPARNPDQGALIDFIREGPPRDAGDHRINRHVAPFRTTMDSDDFNALTPGDRSSMMTNGDRASDTSRTPLVKSNGVAAATMGTKAGATQRVPAIVDEDEEMPAKTRRRVKDPYAIDDSDDEIFNESAPPQRDEESLIDFLRNTAPSQSMTAQPILHSAEQARANLQRSPSGSKIKELVRGRSIPGLGAAAESMRNAPPRAESPHLTQAGSKLDSYRPTQTTHAAHVDRNRTTKTRTETRTAAPAPAPAPATASRGVGATADLADYLKNTGPPPGASYQPQPFLLSSPHPAAKKAVNGGSSPGSTNEGGLKKFFSLRGRK